MSTLLAALAALSFGAADYSGGKASRAHNVPAVLVLSQSVGLAGIVVVAFALGQPAASVADLGWGVLAGLSGVVGLGMLYRGLASGTAAVVSPTAALFGGGIPIVAGVLLGESPSTTAWMGVALALPAILLLSLAREPGARFDRRSIVYGVAAGVGFGGYYILIDRTGTGSGFWPLAAARVASIGLVAVVAVASRRKLVVSSGARRFAVLAGSLDMAANVFFLLATRLGLLVTSAVVSSLYPAPTVVLARVFDRQRLGPRRIAGLVLSLAGVALMAV